MKPNRNTKPLEYYINKLNLIHNYKYDYSLAHKSFKKCISKIEIICPDHGIFIKTIHDHKYQKCPKCSKEERSVDWSLWFSRIRESHGDEYDYSLLERALIKNCDSKIPIVCALHGIFYQTLYNHAIKKFKCPKCRGLHRTKHDWITKANEVHNGIYSYDKEFLSDFPKNVDKIKPICSKHGAFIQTIANHIDRKTGCPLCANTKKGSWQKRMWQYYLSKFQEKHGGLYKYDTHYEFKNNRSKISILCEIHGKFHQSIDSHSRGAGCPICRASKGELLIANLLKSHNITYETQKKFLSLTGARKRPLRFDFFLPELNLIIEYDGEHHFEPIKRWGGEARFKDIQQRDANKNEFCEENNIKLLRISYREDVESILKEKLDL